MNKFTKIRKMAICSVLALSMLTGCAGASAIGAISTPVAGTVNAQATSDFDRELIKFLEDSGLKEKSYMVSPTSFRAALTLAIAGADTETKEELIHAMGFNDMEEVNAWYASVEKLIEEQEDQPGKITMLNSIWNNTDLNCKFSKEYKKYVKNQYNAGANEGNCANITEKVNTWVNKGTEGLIPSISNDLSKVNAALINTLYLKCAWANAFEEYFTETGDFTTARGEQVEKEFMQQQEHFYYYEDRKGQLVVLPLQGGTKAVFVLGEIKDLNEAMQKASLEDVIVKLPKIEVESSFSNNELIDFLNKRGAELAFSPDADFSFMCPETGWYISDIIQKTKITMDEEGVEAAAATAVMMTEGCVLSTEEPKRFTADKTFKFYIVGGENDSEVLFCGQIAE